MEFYTASDARQNLYRLIDKVADCHEPACITGKRNSVVILSQEDYKALQETLYLYNSPGTVSSIEEARKTPREGRLTSLFYACGPIMNGYNELPL